MQDTVANLVAVGFTLFGALCTLLVVAGLPGAWILIGAAVLIDFLDRLWLGPGAALTFHPLTIAAAVVIAAIGEALEFALSAAGAKRFGATRAGMWGSVIGGVFGALTGTFAIPIPVIGTIAGAALGTAAGAVVGELIAGKRTLREVSVPATGAVLGRVLGMLAKLPVAIAVWVVLAIAAFRA